MESNKFFVWTARINSILFLVLLGASIFWVIYAISESNRWSDRNAVEVIDEGDSTDAHDDLRLGAIARVYGSDTTYVALNSESTSKGFSSGGYGRITRNIVFFVGDEMDSHWLYDTDQYLIDEISQLRKREDDCENKDTVAILYQVVKDDTNGDGVLDGKDAITIALTSPSGKSYMELDEGLSAVIDHHIDQDAVQLSVLTQKDKSIIMTKYSIKDGRKISEEQVSRIGKKS